MNDAIAVDLKVDVFKLWETMRNSGVPKSLDLFIFHVVKAHERNNGLCTDIDSLRATGLESANTQLDDAFKTFRDKWLAEPPARATAFDVGLELAIQSGGKFEQMFSSKSLTEVMVSTLLIGSSQLPSDPHIWDPCCGAGTGLVQLASKLRAMGKEPKLLGFEINPRAAEVARANLFVRNLNGHIRQIDALIAGNYAPREAIDLVIADPPMGLNWQKQHQFLESQGALGSLQWGVPPTKDAAWAFAQLAFKALKKSDSARAVVATSRGPLFQMSANSIREKALSQDALESVVLLPSGISAGTSIERALLVMRSQKEVARRNRLTFVDGREKFTTRRGRSGLARELTTDGLLSIVQALNDPRPTRISRTVSEKELYKNQVTASFNRLQTPSGKLSIRHKLSSDIDSSAWMAARYGQATEVSLVEEKSTEVNFTGEWLFGVGHKNHAQNKEALISVFVSAIKLAPNKLRNTHKFLSAGVPRETSWILVTKGGVELSDLPPANRESDAGDDASPSSWRFAFQVDDILSPEYVVAFLNDRAGNSASGLWNGLIGSSTSLEDALSSLDTLAIPILDVQMQEELVSTLTSIHAVRTKSSEDEEFLWQGILTREDFKQRASTYLGSEPLMTRLQSWPNPIASVAWTVEAASDSPTERESAINRFWEAVTGFHSTILMSAINGIPDLEPPTLEDIRRGVNGIVNIRFEEASTGLFALLATTCARRIRNRISESKRETKNEGKREPKEIDDEKGVIRNPELEQIIIAFGGLPLELIERLVSKELTGIFERARPLRTVGAHDGAETRGALSARVSEMYELIREWDVQTRPIWASFELVRAGASHRNKHEGYYEQQIDFMIGDHYPFAKGTTRVIEAYSSGEVYLHCRDSQFGLELMYPLFEFQEWPEESRFACYFYNRSLGETLDLKSFVALPETNVTRRSDAISKTIHWLSGT